MNFTISHLEDQNIVEIITSGLVDHNARKEMVCTAWAALDKTGWKRVLINKEEATRFFDKQMSGALSIIKLMHDLNFSTSTAIAVINSKKELYDDFFEVMARLKGFSVRSFVTRKEAIDWLCQPYKQVD